MSYVSGGGTVKIGSGATTTTTITQTDIDYNTLVSVTAVATIGYSFMGWSTTANGSTFTTNNPYSFNMPAANTTYYAIFLKNFSVTVNAITNGVATTVVKGGTVKINSGTAGYSKTLSIAYSKDITIVAEPEDGYDFVGWYDSETGGSEVNLSATHEFIMPFGHVEYFARFFRQCGDRRYYNCKHNNLRYDKPGGLVVRQLILEH